MRRIGVAVMIGLLAGAAAAETRVGSASLWRLTPGALATTFTITDRGCPEAGPCLRVTVGVLDARTGGEVRSSVDAAPFRGRRARLRATMRVDQVRGGGAYVRAVDEAGAPLAIARASVRGGTRKVSTLLDVPARAARLDVIVRSLGEGDVRASDLALDDVGAAGSGDEPPRALAGRGLDNLVAFARLYGVVRYFHPSDEAARADWEQIAIDGVRAVEGARDAAQLASALDAVFRPLAPSLVLSPGAADNAAAAGGGDLLAWRHTGLGLGNMAYRSERVKLPPGAAPPEPHVADLGGGVTARVPLAVRVDAGVTSPRGAAPRPPGPPPTLGSDRATRLCAVVIAWNVFQHFYPYFDVAPADWPAALRAGLTAAATDGDGRAFAATLRRMVGALHDGHAFLRDGGDDQTELPILTRVVEDKVVVTAVGAAAGDIKVGDVIRSIDGRRARDLVTALEPLQPGATEARRRRVAMRVLALGAPGAESLLVLERAGGRVATVTLRHRALDDREALLEHRPAKVARLAPGIMYVDLSRARDGELAAAMPELARAAGVIFDLRGYPAGSPLALGHLATEQMTSSRWLIPEFTRPDRADMKFGESSWPVAPAEPRITGKVAFLTDEQAISYAETYMAFVEHYKLGAIVGAPTAGTNGNINPFTLPGGYELSWTGMKVLKRDGSRLHGVGVLPTHRVEPTIAGIRAGRDEVLEKAWSIVKAPASAAR